MACRAEHHGHGHSHGDGSGHEDCDHDDPERGLSESLLPYIDIDHVTCLNEATDGMGRSGYPDSLVATRIALMYVAYTAAHPRSWIPNNSDVFRPWADRANLEKYLESDADEQLILYIPFTGNVRLKSIRVIAGGGDERPTKMIAFKNRDDIDFDLAESHPSYSLPPVQEWPINEAASEGDGLPFETKITQFQGIHALVIFFPENNGGDTSRINYIGLQGQCDAVVRRTVITLAEFAANPADHKNDHICAKDENSAQNGY